MVGLGKTLMATAVARIFQDDLDLETLIICPKNLVSMWEDYLYDYGLRGRVISLSRVIGELPTLRRYRLVVIDESHNLRNREGRRYRAIQEYVRANDSKCILLSATSYNKTYHDLSNQLRVFVEDDQDLGIRPERFLRELGEVEFSKRHQASPRTLAAFDLSGHPDDWRDLMRLYPNQYIIKDKVIRLFPASPRITLRSYVGKCSLPSVSVRTFNPQKESGSYYDLPSRLSPDKRNGREGGAVRPSPQHRDP